MDGGIDGISYKTPQPERQPLRPLSVPQRRQVELELQLARQRLQRQQFVRGARHFLHFSFAFGGEFCLSRASADFRSWPFHPPSIFPTSFILTERAMYFLLSTDFVSHNTVSNMLNVSIFFMAKRTYGCFSLLERKVAAAIA